MSNDTKNAGLSANGWAAVPRSFKKSLADVDKNKQAEMSVDEAKPPSSDIAKKTHAFAKEQLPEKTFNHSMRVWYFGKQQILVGTLTWYLYMRPCTPSHPVTRFP
jgi:cyanamide hydratase